MKRNLIAVIIATLAAGAAFAEPSLSTDVNRFQAAPEATSYIADTRAMDEVQHSLLP
jgi:hypothetical protein